MGKKVEQSLIEITNSASNEGCFSSTLICHYEHCVTTVPLLVLLTTVRITITGHRDKPFPLMFHVRNYIDNEDFWTFRQPCTHSRPYKN